MNARPAHLCRRVLGLTASVLVTVQRLSLPFVELRTAYLAVGSSVYRDNIHHSAQGQKVMADTLFTAVMRVLPGAGANPLLPSAGERP